jgi:hypothetical protein
MRSDQSLSISEFITSIPESRIKDSMFVKSTNQAEEIFGQLGDNMWSSYFLNSLLLCIYTTARSKNEKTAWSNLQTIMA